MVPGSAWAALEAFDRHVRNAAVADDGLRIPERGAYFMDALNTIANVVDPNFTVVAKMRKSMLPRR
jgi:hypothetical protein